MKASNACPKCDSKVIIRIQGSIWKDGARIPCGFFHPPVPVNHYVCAQCGFVELWVEKGLDQLESVHLDGASRATKAAGGEDGKDLEN